MLTRRVPDRALLVAAALALSCGHRAPAEPVAPSSGTAPPVEVDAESLVVGTDAAAESLLADVRQADTTIRTDVRYATDSNFTGRTLPGYEAPRILLRREAAAALARVQRRLRVAGLGLKVFDGYRPIRATRAMVAWANGTGHRWVLTQGYVARRSRHNLGVAVDLTLVELEGGGELPMGTPFDTFSEAAHTANARGRVLRNRQLLVRAMASEGFRNYDQEWWHFTYPVEGAMAFDLVIR